MFISFLLCSLGKSKVTVLGAPSDSRKNKFSFVLRITSIVEKHFCNLVMQEKRNYHQVEIRAASLRCYNIDIEFFYNYIISNKVVKHSYDLLTRFRMDATTLPILYML